MKKRRKQVSKSTCDEDFEAFCRSLPALLKTNPGQFVAFSGGRLIDKDPDEFALVERVARQHPGQRVLIQPVVETRLVDVHMDTPEFEFERQMDELAKAEGYLNASIASTPRG